MHEAKIRPHLGMTSKVHNVIPRMADGQKMVYLGLTMLIPHVKPGHLAKYIRETAFDIIPIKYP